MPKELSTSSGVNTRASIPTFLGSSTADSPVIVRRPTANEVPVVATVPHGSRLIPEEIARHIALPLEKLWSDWYVAKLYSFLPSLGITTVLAAYSPFFVNVNRDQTTLFGDYWRAIVPQTSPLGEAVYLAEPSEEELARRLRLAYNPFHEALGEEMDRVVVGHGRALLLDLHSFGMPLEEDVVLGDARGKTARPEVVSLIERQFRSVGLSVARNKRFTGGWVVRRFAGHPLVDAVQVEVNQRLYLDCAEIDAAVQPPTLIETKLSQAKAILSRVTYKVISGLGD